MTATLLARLKRVVGRDTHRVIRECRRCGTTVDHETECCPACGAAEVARYEIP
ncbi:MULTISPECIES: hypothetical protein [Natrialbaceae]|uniref:hypothetical protein n=1 Tax=Natrialbaceae TaxID=1644061 RepID=UPI00207CFF67|nr:hypothetical protein [Natronococcus sp. CG52]